MHTLIHAHTHTHLHMHTHTHTCIHIHMCTRTHPQGGAQSSARDYLKQQIPLQRLGTRTDIAEAALYLASDLASFVTGSVLVVDGGSWMTSGQSFNTMAEIHSKL